MTMQPGQYIPPAPQPPPPPPYYYTAQPGTAAVDLLMQLDAAKAAEEDAKRLAADLVKQIEAQVAADVAAVLPPGSRLPSQINIRASAHWTGRVMRWKIPRKFNRKGFDAAYPGVYAAWITDGDGYWQLDPEKNR
jgi:hypothetical protein